MSTPYLVSSPTVNIKKMSYIITLLDWIISWWGVLLVGTPTMAEAGGHQQRFLAVYQQKNKLLSQQSSTTIPTVNIFC